ncbi:MAG: electron transfer flavoprotein subunit alpha/FixB family protein [Deltaproteobacteria bacterium]|nr:electron transfer flavoprotein subunit alpha/FixB family protein [Deltaproteobacteria bacterium]
MAGVWIFSERYEQLLELLNAGRRLARSMGTKLSAMSQLDPEKAATLFSHGADAVLVLPPLSENPSLDAFIPVIVAEVRKEDPDVFLLSATLRGRELAARIAARLNTGLCGNCIALEIDRDDGALRMERLVYGGAGLQAVTCSSRPAMASIPPGTFEPAPADGEGKGVVRTLPAPPPSAVQIIERKTKTSRGTDIAEARVVIGVGRGFEKEEDLHLAGELAEALGGEIGCTRPISAELHWLPEEVCIGLSGLQVKPDLYVGLGISGQIQHATGIRSSKWICAVNKDENAPIFAVADFGIVGDLYDVIPKLIAALKN